MLRIVLIADDRRVYTHCTRCNNNNNNKASSSATSNRKKKKTCRNIFATGFQNDSFSGFFLFLLFFLFFFFICSFLPVTPISRYSRYLYAYVHTYTRLPGFVWLVSGGVAEA